MVEILNDEKLNDRFENGFKVCFWDLNKLVLLLYKGGCPYENMNIWEKFKETSLSSIENYKHYTK